jgi:hypothetical protein
VDAATEYTATHPDEPRLRHSVLPRPTPASMAKPPQAAGAVTVCGGGKSHGVRHGGDR